MNPPPSILSISFRPFFLSAALIASFNPILWIFSFLGDITLPFHNVTPLFWHAHEMLFGFVGALIAGFIFTASANWTNTRPYQGGVLLLLIACWIIERLVYFIPFPINLQLILMNIFYPLMTLLLFLKLKNFPKQKYIFIPILLGLGVAKTLHSVGQIYEVNIHLISGKEFAIGLIRLIILVIAGRVFPFFTAKRISGIIIKTPKWLNLLAMIPIVFLALPYSHLLPRTITIFLLLCAILLNIYRQILWHPLKTLRIPILFILHLGIGFINFGLIFELLRIFIPQLDITQISLHLLMASGLGAIGIGMMSRVSLGHTGRVIESNSWIIVSYCLVVLGSIVRVVIPLIAPNFYSLSLYFSSGIWGSGFLIYICMFYKILINPRPDGRPY